MFIEEIFCTLRDRLMETGIYSVGYEYCELVTQNSSKGGTVTEPKYAEGGGTKAVYNLDKNGTFYIRKTQDSSVNLDTNRIPVKPCDWDKYIVMTMPCRVVAAVLKEKFEFERFADEVHIATITNAIQGKLSLTDTTIKTIATVGRTSTDAGKIWNEEVKGVEFKEMNFARFSYVSVDFNIQINAHISCLSACQTEY